MGFAGAQVNQRAHLGQQGLKVNQHWERLDEHHEHQLSRLLHSHVSEPIASGTTDATQIVAGLTSRGLPPHVKSRPRSSAR